MLREGGPDSDALARLLEEAGAVRLRGGRWLLNCGEISEEVVLVVLPDDAADLDARIREAISAGQRVIGIWRAGSEDAPLPQVMAEYGGAAIGWSADLLRRTICEEAANWEDASGQGRGDQGTKRNVC